jgi:hypothetical protein
MKKILLGALVAAAAVAAPAHAVTYTYVGSWEVDQGPNWAGSPPDGPLAYTGQEAAALLFGGSASNYVTSTVDSNPANIDGNAWYSIIGYGSAQFADNYSSKYLGLYYGPTSGYPNGDSTAAASSYVWDNAQGSSYMNYAFTVAGVPESATWAMMLVGMGAIGFAMRRRATVTVSHA